MQTLLERRAAMPEPIRGTIRLTAADLRLQRRVTLLFTAGPLVGVGLAMTLLWRHGISALSLSLFASFYIFTGLGITVGFHRLFTHR
ncbi:MAG: acyl-CoA desaturase, partial [Actinomycetota bacterium]